MAQKEPNPDQYESHFPNFRNVEWNPNPLDIGAIVQGQIGQSLVRNTVFDRLAGLWRLASGDSVGRTLVSNGAVTGVILSTQTFAVPAGGIQIAAQNSSRSGIYVENLSPESINLGFALPITGFVVTFPNDTYINMQGYQGVLVADNGVSIAVATVLVIEYQ
jgi:hypothetical protein